MHRKTVAIIGRPNVGKSTLFNRLIGAREAVTANEAGTTRDRKSGVCQWDKKEITVIDTGGFAFGKLSDDVFQKDILDQINFALEETDEIIFVLDSKSEIGDEDYEIAKRLRKSDKKIYLVANKADQTRDEVESQKFIKLGFDKVFPISAISGRGVSEFLDEVVKGVPIKTKVDLTPRTRVAIVGRPNVGKSSLINKILGEDRVIVSDIPGTTRDSIEVTFRYKKNEIILTDTAGIRKQGKIKVGAEKFGVERARHKVLKSNRVILVTDATEGLTRGDAHIAEFAMRLGKPLLLLINKTDLMEDKNISNLHRFAFLKRNPALYISAKTGRNMKELLDWIVGEELELK